MSHHNLSKIVTWSVVAGAAIALSAEVTLNFLGMGLGLTSIDMSASSMFKTGAGSVIWLAVSGIVTMFLGGWVAGKVSNHSYAKSRMLHGLLAWSFATLITVMVSTTAAGALVGGSTNMVKNSVSSLSKQAMPSTTSYSGASDNSSNSDENTNDNNASDKATNNLGAASIAMFIAFILSALASLLGAFWAKPVLSPEE